MSKSVTILAPDAATADVLRAYAVSIGKADLLTTTANTPTSADGRQSFMHFDWPKGFTAKATELGCKVMDWKDAQGQHWAAKESFVEKAAVEGK